MEKLLVGIDEERASQVAVDWVIERAKTRSVQVALFTAFDMITNDPVKGDALLMSTRARIEEAVPSVIVTVELADRSILEGLIERSAEADLLVIGSHPHRKVRSILTGALPSALVVRAQCPTIVVPNDWQPGGASIVLGVAGDHSSDSAILFAADEAHAAGIPLAAVHAWRLPVPAMDAVSSLVADPDLLEDIHRGLLERVTERLGAAAGEAVVTGIMLHGDSPAALDAVLDDAALLVLGTHGHGPAIGALLGSTVQQMLHHGRVPIAVVANPQAGGRQGRVASRTHA